MTQPMAEGSSKPETIDKSMSFILANLLAGLLACPATLLCIGPYVLLWGGPRPDAGNGVPLAENPMFLIGLLVILIVSVVAHELLHAAGFLLRGAASDDIRFGMKMLTPYAHYTVPVELASYRLAIALPGVVLGIVPAIAGIASGIIWLTLYGTVMFVGALGDALILWLLRDAPPGAMVIDHPSKIGCEIIVP